MNKPQSTNYQRPDFTEVPASSIPPVTSETPVTIHHVIKTLDNFLNNSENHSHVESHFLNKGLGKPMGDNITLQGLIKNFNTLVMEYVISSNKNKNMDLKQKNILKHYVTSVNEMSNIIDNVDIEVAGEEIMCYIVGYMIKTLKNTKINTLYDNR